jgi:hypothetical protein
MKHPAQNKISVNVAMWVVYSLFQISLEVCIISIFQKRKLKFTEVKNFFQIHSARKELRFMLKYLLLESELSTIILQYVS